MPHTSFALQPEELLFLIGILIADVKNYQKSIEDPKMSEDTKAKAKDLQTSSVKLIVKFDMMLNAAGIMLKTDALGNPLWN